MKRKELENFIIKNKDITNLFMSKVFKKMNLSNYLYHIGFVNHYVIVGLFITTLCLPFITYYIKESFPNFNVLFYLLFGVVSWFIAFCNMIMISCFFDNHIKDGDNDLSVLGIFLIPILFTLDNLFLLKIGLTKGVIIGFSLYSIFPISYILGYIGSIISFFINKKNIPTDKYQDITHEDNIAISKHLSKEDMGFFLDVYKKYSDLPFEEMEKNYNSTKKEDYLDSLY